MVDRGGARSAGAWLLGRLPLGYHQLSVEPQSAVCTVIVTPRRCFLPESGAERGLWGLALQLYLLRSERNLGVGDFGDLAAVARAVTGRGCDVLGLNPLHAPFPDDMELASPYSPASRLLLNPLNIDVGAALEICPSPAAAALMAERRCPGRGPQLPRSRHARLPPGRCSEGAGSAARVCGLACGRRRRRNEFAAFRALQGTSFERHCLYFALRAHMLAEGLGAGDWHGWPQPYQDSRAAVVARFARTHADEVTWVAWQQWLADRQLAAAAGAAEPMRVGLYRDLAVGAECCGRRDLGRAGPHGARVAHRRAARRRLGDGPRVGFAAAASRAPAGERLSQLRRAVAGQHAARGRAAHRPCHGARAALRDPEGRAGRGRHVPRLPVRRSRGHRGARERSQPLPHHRRGFGSMCRTVFASAWPSCRCCRTGCCDSSATATAS